MQGPWVEDDPLHLDCTALMRLEVEGHSLAREGMVRIADFVKTLEWNVAQSTP